MPRSVTIDDNVHVRSDDGALFPARALVVLC